MAAGASVGILSLDAVAKEMWSPSGSVAVLPINRELKLFDVVEFEKGKPFKLLGNLVDLCAEGDAKVFLRDLIARTGSNPESQDLGLLERDAKNDTIFFSRFMGFPMFVAQMVVAALTHVASWKISIPSHERVRVDDNIVAQVLEKFVPSKEFYGHFEGRALEMWIVTNLTTAASVSLDPHDVNGNNSSSGLSSFLSPSLQPRRRGWLTPFPCQEERVRGGWQSSALGLGLQEHQIHIREKLLELLEAEMVSTTIRAHGRCWAK